MKINDVDKGVVGLHCLLESQHPVLKMCDPASPDVVDVIEDNTKRRCHTKAIITCYFLSTKEKNS